MALVVITAGFLVAALIHVGQINWSNTRDRALGLASPASFATLLMALAVILGLGTPATSTMAFVGQGTLLAAAAALFFSARALHRGKIADVAQVVDTATVDALTRVASHRVFQDRLVHECERAYRFGDTFVLLMLDLDSFHPINNRLGHRTGDRILLELARRLRSQLREIDLVARFGGDQFAMILPHTFEKGGLDVAERLRQNVASWVFAPAGEAELRLTASLGVCSYPQDGASAPQLVEAASNALRFANNMGGNQVQLSRDLPRRPASDNVVSLPNSGRGAIVRSLAAAVDIRDGYTHKHSHMVSELSAAIARRMGLPGADVARISEGALLHDVGKIGVPDSILTKKGSLSPEEWTAIQQHPLLGKQIIEQAPELVDVMPLVLHHQERYDGTGYPHHLQGDEIPLGARIIAAADAYHAIRSDRPYRSGRTHREATSELRRCSGRQFDPRIVEALISILDSDETLQAVLPADQTLIQMGLARTAASGVS